MSKLPLLPPDYGDWLKNLKSRIASARQRAALAINQELVTLYYSIGKDILQRQANEGWGSKVIQRLSSDLGEAFPDMKGFSTRNLQYMRLFAEQCPELQFVQQPAAQLPWFHIVSLLTKITNLADREWYATRSISEGWSRTTLDSHIKSQLHRRQGAAVTNFERHLPEPQAQLALATLKDPYLFDFLGLGDEAHERDIENALIRHITRFLLELGVGFAFLGRKSCNPPISLKK